MKKTKITIDQESFPEEIRPYICNKDIYDSSSSPEAKVYFVDCDYGYYIKRGPAKSLNKEAMMTEYFNKLSLAPEIIAYVKDRDDWLITRSAKGEDLTHASYLSRPIWLAGRLGELLSELHSIKATDSCPIKDRTGDYFKTCEANKELGNFDLSYHIPSHKFSSPSDAYREFLQHRNALKSDTLIHGDFCLPNIIMQNDAFSSYIDLGGAGIGDRHIDIFWAAWTLSFNLGTDKYRSVFYDAYGRDKIDEEALLAVCAAEVFG